MLGIFKNQIEDLLSLRERRKMEKEINERKVEIFNIPNQQKNIPIFQLEAHYETEINNLNKTLRSK